MKKLDNNTTEIDFSSKPVLPTVLIDYGINLKNVEIISQFLREISKA